MSPTYAQENYLTEKTGLGTLEFGPTKPAKRKAYIHALQLHHTNHTLTIHPSKGRFSK